jgi:predicted nucleic acid-binding protein
MASSHVRRSRVFVDSSVLFAASLSRTGYARELVLLGTDHLIELVTSNYVLGETRRNLWKKAVLAIPNFDAFLTIGIFDLSDPPSQLVLDVADLIEPKDAPVVAGAVAANCGWIATFDRKHLLSEAERILQFWDLVVDEPGAIIPRLELDLPED